MNEISEQAETLQNLLLSHATGHLEDNAEYLRLRQVLLSKPSLDSYIPRFVRTCRSLFQFWEFIKHEFSTYAERRQFIWDEFRPLLEVLEKGGPSPADDKVSSALDELDPAHVQAVWSKALDRRQSDPEGAITVARTLLETVCKFILDDLRVNYSQTDDLPKLYRATATALNLAPSQHTEEVFKQVLGGCTAVVEGLGSLRNRLSDSHGQGRAAVRAAPRHAELAVNLSGAMAAFLVETWKTRQQTNT